MLEVHPKLVKLPEDNVHKIEPELREVILGNKPACCIPITSINTRSIDYLQHLGFECIATKNAIGAIEEEVATLLTIAKKTKATDYFTQEIKDFFKGRFPDLSSRLDFMFRLAEEHSTATLLSMLSSYKRVDDVYNVETHNLERPEVAIVTGILLGYPQKDVDYYIRTRYMGEPVLEHISTPDGEYGYIRDPN